MGGMAGTGLGLRALAQFRTTKILRIIWRPCTKIFRRHLVGLWSCRLFFLIGELSSGPSPRSLVTKQTNRPTVRQIESLD